jgi:hypothetical protein
MASNIGRAPSAAQTTSVFHVAAGTLTSNDFYKRRGDSARHEERFEKLVAFA